MPEPALFTLPDPEPDTPPLPTRAVDARIVRPVRNQVQFVPQTLDELLPDDHPARAIWQALEQLDLAGFYHDIQALVDGPGRPATDPQVLLAVWLLATVEGIGSARQVARLCKEHAAYRWLCGGVPVNYHTLSDFRVGRQAQLDQLLTQLLASLMATDLVALQRVAQDGVRVRASAGAASFGRQPTLARCLAEAQAQVARLAQEREHPDPGVTRREQAARERAAREREARVRQALAYLPQVQASKARQRATYTAARSATVTEPRLSTTDPEARVMKMPDGGFRPAYNVELATDAAQGIIVGVAVTTAGGDAGQAAPLEAQVARRTGQHPQAYLMDGGFATHPDITTLERRGVSVYAPVPPPRTRPPAQRYAARPGDSAEVVRWRARMQTAAAQQVYRQRAATAEWTNAQLRQHGLTRFTGRGLAKVTAVVLWLAISHNLLRWAAVLS